MTTLAASIDADDRILTVDAVLAGAEQGYRFRLDDEILELSGFDQRLQSPFAFDMTRWRVNRGVDDSVAASHSGGTTVRAVRPAWASSSDTSVPLPFAADEATDLVYDRFDRYADGDFDGEVPIVGPAWATSGDDPPTIASGLMVSASSGYAFGHVDEAPTYLECTGVFAGTPPSHTAQAIAMGWTGDDESLDDLLHLTVGPYNFNLTVSRTGGGNLAAVMSGEWSGRVLSDGATRYKFAMYLRGDTCTIIGPHGERFSVADARFSQISITTAFWQPTTSGAFSSKLASVRAVARPPSEPDIGQAPNILDASVGSREVVAADDTFWQINLGQDSVNGFPAMFFGPSLVRTYLTAAVSVGGGTITTNEPVLPGSTIVGFGADEETVTVTGAPTPLPGAGWPYVHTLVGTLANAHSAGTYVQGIGVTRPSMYWNPYSPNELNVSIGLILAGILKATAVYDNNFSQLLTSRRTGWGAPTGTPTRTTFATSTVTLEELAQRVKALVDDLTTHGLIGP